MRKLSFLCGLAFGYVLGARAGRERYEQIRKSARDLSQSPAVQKATRSARDAVGSQLGDRLPPAVTDRIPGLRRQQDGAADWDSAPGR
ncbi:hypothetical protein [Phaeacidiphilus oryzae]|uniref:hypothetical protein n=1 Tax=Phaeacidiphilus oryzae TaxID=348818 RepID=UPI0005621A10|nr:hypothetical protein [Phaeacidiphilus oryzae]